MGLKFIDSLLTLLAVGPAVASVYFIGYAISVEDAPWAWITAGILLAVALMSGFLLVRRIRGYRERPPVTHH